MAKYGMPYQGSKQAIADELIKQFPKADHFYDLFGGGGSISHAMVVNRAEDYKTINYNELDPLTVQLLRDSIDGKYDLETFRPEWVSREEFFKRKDSDGFVRACYSFGNDNRTYLYGKHIEGYKKSMHMAVVFGKFDDLATGVFGFSEWPQHLLSANDRGAHLRRRIKDLQKNNSLPEVLSPYLPNQTNGLQTTRQPQNLENLYRNSVMERCSHLELTQNLHQIKITNLPYDQVPIQDNSIIYCDIPYDKTKGYQVLFDRQKFLDWAANNPHPVYISEYNIEDPRFQLVWEIQKRKGMQRGATATRATEKLYVNRAGLNKR